MSSWLNEAIGRVTEQGGSLVKGGAQALRQRASQVRARFGGAVSQAELETQLERRAREVTSSPGGSVLAREELCATWLRQLHSSASQGGSSSSQATASAKSLRTALLHGAALKPLVAASAADRGAGRPAYVGAGAPDSAAVGGIPHAGGVPALRALLNVLLGCPEALRAEILDLAFGDAHVFSKQHVQWLAEVVNLGLADGTDEGYVAEQRDVTVCIEKLLTELSQLDAEVLNVAPGDFRHARQLSFQRVSVSGELLETCLALRQTIEEAQAHHRGASESRCHALGSLSSEAAQQASVLRTSPPGIADHQRALQAQLREAYDVVQAQMQQFDLERIEAERAIAELEGKKLEISRKIEDVNQQLQSAQDGQRQHLQRLDQQRAEVDRAEASFRARIKAEDAAAARATQQQTAAQRTEAMIGRISEAVQAAISGQITELEGKQAQFGGLFKEILRDHISIQIEHAQHIRKEAETCASTVLEHKAKVEMLNIMGMSTKSIVDPSELCRLERAAKRADSARQGFEAFRRDYGLLLDESAAQEHVRQLQKHHEHVQAILAPCRVFLGDTAAEPAMAAAAASLPSAAAPGAAFGGAPVSAAGVAPPAIAAFAQMLAMEAFPGAAATFMPSPVPPGASPSGYPSAPWAGGTSLPTTLGAAAAEVVGSPHAVRPYSAAAASSPTFSPAAAAAFAATATPSGSPVGAAPSGSPTASSLGGSPFGMPGGDTPLARGAALLAEAQAKATTAAPAPPLWPPSAVAAAPGGGTLLLPSAGNAAWAPGGGTLLPPGMPAPPGASSPGAGALLAPGAGGPSCMSIPLPPQPTPTVPAVASAPQVAVAAAAGSAPGC
mmetsp:Transcript_74985/g.243685  ORF Transcript_74985/g.243685 Transcript_74985/m.243685 type:complete len:841 (+) Transcript_74985:80-2602(+)